MLWSRKPGEQMAAIAEQGQVIRRPDDSEPTSRRTPVHRSEHPAADKTKTLEEYERSITASRRSWASDGRALGEIKRLGLHTERCESFDDYIFERWGFTGRKADDLIRGASIARSIQQIDHALSLSAALQLAHVDANTRAACLAEAIAAARSRSPSAEQVAAAAAKFGAKAKKRRVSRPKPEKHPLGTITILPKKVTVVAKKAGDDLQELLRVALAKLSPPSQSEAA